MPSSGKTTHRPLVQHTKTPHSSGAKPLYL
jgi:hypothetical protein